MVFLGGRRHHIRAPDVHYSKAALKAFKSGGLPEHRPLHYAAGTFTLIVNDSRVFSCIKILLRTSFLEVDPTLRSCGHHDLEGLASCQ